MSRKKKSMIGFDPLAWLADDENEGDENVKSSTTANSKVASGQAEKGQAKKDKAKKGQTKKDKAKKGQTKKDKAKKGQTKKDKADNNSADDVLTLQNIQDISKSALLKQQIMVLIKDSKHIQIDASDVSRVDGSALQLLCALFAYANTHDIQLSWIKPSEAMLASAEYLGMKEQLKLRSL